MIEFWRNPKTAAHMIEKAEDRGRKTEGRRQKAEGRGQKAEGRRQKTEDRRQKGTLIADYAGFAVLPIAVPI
jgi:hypothetical protein